MSTASRFSPALIVCHARSLQHVPQARVLYTLHSYRYWKRILRCSSLWHEHLRGCIRWRTIGEIILSQVPHFNAFIWRYTTCMLFSKATHHHTAKGETIPGTIRRRRMAPGMVSVMPLEQTPATLAVQKRSARM